MNETIGQILKKTRLDKKVTVKDASEATNITSRHISALEEDNFDIFPGDIYTLGFLRSYSTYLGLDPDYMIQIYRGNRLEEIETPIKQLTEPTITTLDYIQKYATIPLLILFIAVIGYFGFQAFAGSQDDDPGSQPAMRFQNMEDFLQTSKTIPDVETEHIKISSGYTTALISIGGGIDFSVNNQEIYLVLDSLEYEPSNEAGNMARLFLYPGKRPIMLRGGEMNEISYDDIRPFKISLMGSTPNTIKVRLEVSESLEDSAEENDMESHIANPSNFIIVFEGITTGDNFVEFFVDGKPRKRGLLKSGSRLYYEANESIQMKIGDAGAIEIKINGKEYNFGKRGQQVNKIIRKVKDPVEQTRFQIMIKDA